MTKIDAAEFNNMLKGDENSFMRLFDAFYPAMMQRGLFFVNDQAVVEDIVQDAFITLWNDRRQFRKIRNVEWYLSRWIRNRCLNHLEHRGVVDKYRRNHKHEVLDPHDSDPEPYIAAIGQLIMRMPEKRQKAFEMSVYDNMSYLQIAEAMDISINTVKDHIKKAYEFLRNNSAYIPYP